MSKAVPLFFGTAENGKLELDDRDMFKMYLSSLKGRVYVEVGPRGKRTLPQNSFYWLYMTLIAEETGDNPNDLHEFFKRKLLPPRFKIIMKEEIKLPATTTDLNKNEFGDYMEKICALSAVPIPDPNKLNIKR